MDAWWISAVEGCRKPDVRILARAAEKCGASLASVWMIGDSPEADIAAGHFARIGERVARWTFAPLSRSRSG